MTPDPVEEQRLSMLVAFGPLRTPPPKLPPEFVARENAAWAALHDPTNPRHAGIKAYYEKTRRLP